MTNSEPRTLTGLAIGDALGMPFESKDHGDPLLASWDGSFQPCPASHPYCRGLRPGQWTDDTKMAMALSESLVHCKTYDPADAASMYLGWYRSNDWRGIGTATKQSMKALDSGRMWLESGVPGAEGNGTAMRIAPLGLFLRSRIPSLVARCARMDAEITHDSDEAREGSAVVALSVAHLAGGGSKGSLHRFLSACLESGTLRSCRTVLRSLEVDYYANQAVQSGSPSVAVNIVANVLRAGGHVVETVPAALFCLLTTSSFKESVELAVRAGGDTDTTAAVAGALAGTLYGSPGTHRYTALLERAHDMTRLDQSLYSLDQAWGPR